MFLSEEMWMESKQAGAFTQQTYPVQLYFECQMLLSKIHSFWTTFVACGVFLLALIFLARDRHAHVNEHMQSSIALLKPGNSWTVVR